MGKSSQDEPNAVRLDGWVAGVTALQREMLDFVANRLKKDGVAIRGAIASGNLGDALSIQQQWVTETVNDYLTESTKVVRLLAEQGSAFPQFDTTQAAAEPYVEAKPAEIAPAPRPKAT